MYCRTGFQKVAVSAYRVGLPKCDVIKFSFLHFSIFMTIFQQNMMKNPHAPNLTWIGSWWPEIWPYKYLISPIEISVNWPGSKQLWTRPIYTDFTGLIRYSCSHISGPHESIPTKFGLWMFFIMLYRYMVSKTLKCKKSFLWCHCFCTLWEVHVVAVPLIVFPVLVLVRQQPIL